MEYLFHKPSPPLDIYVEVLWLYDGYRPPHSLERVLPSGTVELVINLEDDLLRTYDTRDLSRVTTFRGPLLAGAQAAYTVIDTAQQRSIMGAHFHPGGAHAVLDLPADEVAHMDVELAQLWGADALHLRDQLDSAPRPLDKLLCLERALRRRLFTRRRQLEHRAAGYALARLEAGGLDQPPSMEALAEDCGLSNRRFIEVFSRQVGLTPKAYARVRRFQKALARIHRRLGQSADPHPATAWDWCQLALEHGYYDQAHFNREFRAFSGISPGAYVALGAKEMNHVPLPERGQICPIPAAA